MSIEQQRLDAIMRENFLAFFRKVFETLHPGDPPVVIGWYLRAICHHLSEAEAGRLRKQVINTPPRHMKSILTTVALPAWLLGRDPTRKVLVATYSQDLARLHAEHCRIIMESDWYKRMFSSTRISKTGNRQLELVTTCGGFRKAISVEGGATGFGADFTIVDDCMKADDTFSAAAREKVRRWYDNTLVTRTNKPQHGATISISQRLCEDDLPAHLLTKGFAHLNLPAIAERDELIAIGPELYHQRRTGDLLCPEWRDQAALEELRRDLGAELFSAQFQQNPVAPGGNRIRLEWFESYGLANSRSRSTSSRRATPSGSRATTRGGAPSLSNTRVMATDQSGHVNSGS